MLCLFTNMSKYYTIYIKQLNINTQYKHIYICTERLRALPYRELGEEQRGSTGVTGVDGGEGGSAVGP